MSNVSDLQAILDSKIILLASIVAKLADIIANPKVTYSIDQQMVSWSEYNRWLIDSQSIETKAILDLRNLIILMSTPPFHQSSLK